MADRRRIGPAARKLAYEMLSAGQSITAVQSAFVQEGYGKPTLATILRLCWSVVKPATAAKHVSVEWDGNAGGRDWRRRALWETVDWIGRQLRDVSIDDVAPATLKALLSERREYCKQIAIECGEWDVKPVLTGVVRSMASRLPSLSQEDLDQLTSIRRKLEGPG